MQPKDPNNWYDRHGVERPKVIPHLTDEEREKKFKEIRENTVHGDWKLQGNYLSCHKCPMSHGDFISPEYLLMGTDEDGLPILKKLDL